MIKIYPYKELGHANHGWLDAHHHFSFADYYNPDRPNFGAIRVINDDTISANSGFDTHPHRNMEIITYIRSGAITHRDNKDNEGRTTVGNVQVMTAGKGIFHSEHNEEDTDTTLYQIWIEPKQTGLEPRWDQAEFPKTPKKEALTLLVSGDGNAPLHINQDAQIYAGTLTKGTTLIHPIKNQAYLLVSEGQLQIDNQSAQKGDGAEITNQETVTLNALTDAEVLVIDVPKKTN